MSRASKIKSELKKSEKFVKYFELPDDLKGLNRDEMNSIIESIIENLKEKGEWK